ncbi:ATP-binding cassette domain-containing protein [Streptomyces sp. NBRC 110028]|uniref:ATP-binding cassette domain-containing protein n=1 Tax=Streptomyces sp. NBRC 110028 TaxID=1621260 RepID=UPI0007C67E9E
MVHVTGTPDGGAGAAVTAGGLGVKGSHGWAYRDVALTADPGALIAVEGPSGSGRTCLLLTLTGRMRPTTGEAAVGGFRVPRQMRHIRRISALAHVPGVTELDPALTVAEHLRERALLQRRFGDSPRGLLRPRRERATASRAAIEAALAAAGLDPEALPKGARTAVRDLERLEALRLSVALALISRPRLLAVDDTDLKLSDAERERAWTLLREIAESGITVLAVCSQAPEGAVVVPTAADARTGTPDTTQDDEEGAADALAETGRA